MTKEEKKQFLMKQIVRIERLIDERQPVLDAEARRITRQLDRRLMRRKKLLIMLSFPNGN